MHQGAPRPWVFEKKSTRITILTAIFTSDAEQMRVAVLNHLGIANGPAWLFAKEITSGAVHHPIP